ncbi:MAG: helix-turn-helix domain-containing protein [Anaeroplasmataceae bacterium]|nr:helix-turn-helix domain-containing protein [Anaeroplasmataceae bacterium]
MSEKELVQRTYNDILKKINEVICRKEINKTNLAKKLGISRQTLYDYLNGINIMPYDIVLHINMLLNS